MNYFQNVYIFFHSFFEFLTFRTKPKYKSFDDNEECEFIIFNENYIDKNILQY